MQQIESRSETVVVGGSKLRVGQAECRLRQLVVWDRKVCGVARPPAV